MLWVSPTMNGIYCGPAPLPDDIWMRWNFDPALLLALVIIGIAIGRSAAGLSATAVLIIVFVSPLCALSAALFSARAVHHVLLIAVAAPLIAAVVPVIKARALVPSFAAFAITLWAWHVPAAYDLALSHMGIYWVMQIALFGAAVWFWREVLAPSEGYLGHLSLVIASFAQMGLLGALLTFAPVPLYEIHALASSNWGVLPLTDQQLGGLIMWILSGVPFAIITIALVRRNWIEAENASR